MSAAIHLHCTTRDFRVRSRPHMSLCMLCADVTGASVRKDVDSPCIVLAEESEELLPDVLAVQCRPPLGDGAVSNSRLHGGVRNVREEVRARIELAQGFIFLGHINKNAANRHKMGLLFLCPRDISRTTLIWLLTRDEIILIKILSTKWCYERCNCSYATVVLLTIVRVSGRRLSLQPS